MDRKGIASVVLYTLGIAISFVAPAVARWIYVSVAPMWLVPDSRMEKGLRSARFRSGG